MSPIQFAKFYYGMFIAFIVFHTIGMIWTIKSLLYLSLLSIVHIVVDV